MRIRSKKILVVEDDEAILELICLRVELAGHHAIPVKSGLQAIHHIDHGAPDAMILDIGLPTADGFSVLRSMAGKGQHIPTLMLTARKTAKDVCAAMDLGARDYLTKPFDTAIFLEKLDRLLSADSGPTLVML